MILNTVVLWLHIISAIGWLGAVMVFGMVIGPSLSKLSGSARGEFMAKVAPRFVNYIEIFSIMTLIFGVGMLAVIADGSMSIISLSTTFGLCISIGAILALVAVALAFAVVVPATHKIVRISQSMLQNPGPPPAELMAASNRLKVGSTTAMVLLIIVTVFMVAAATL
jgi:uncharacterized membrane protein